MARVRRRTPIVRRTPTCPITPVRAGPQDWEQINHAAIAEYRKTRPHSDFVGERREIVRVCVQLDEDSQAFSRVPIMECGIVGEPGTIERVLRQFQIACEVLIKRP